MINSLRLFCVFVGCIVVMSCTSRKNGSEQINLSLLSEGDTLPVNQLPKNLKLWMDFHGGKDTQISLRDFICSGVILHQDELILLDSTIDLSRLFNNKHLVFSPDSKIFIDLFSITRMPSNDSSTLILPYAPDIDQQVVVGFADGRRYELFFCGPQQLVESADWINEHQLILLINTFEEGRNQSEIYLFDLDKRIFTNFSLQKELEKNKDQQYSFIEYWIKIIEQEN